MAPGPDGAVSAQGMDVAQIAKVVFTSPDRVREVLHSFSDDGFASLEPKYAGGRRPTFTLPERREAGYRMPPARLTAGAPRIATL